MMDQRYSDNDQTKRDIPSFIEPRPPMISNPFMRPRPQKGTNLLELFEEDSETEEPELVQVYLRMKPHNGPNHLYEVKSDRCLITSVDTATAGHGRRTQHNVSKMYTFSQIFGPESTQKEIFEHVIKGNLKKLPDGHSFTLLTYGASGSGKTFTLMGTVSSPGLVPRSLEYVFRVVDAAQQPLFKPGDGGADKLNYAEQDYELQWVKRLRRVSAPLRDKYRRMSAGLCNDFTASTLDLTNRARHYVWVSFVEIYNEGIYDLLASTDRTNASKLRIREDTNGHVYVKGATQAFVRTGEEAYDVMVAGKHNLQVAATGVHAHSSRSHCIFTITMLTETEGGVRPSCVRLCDLAGCERARHTRNTGARMAESRAINSSLHVLERCLHTLRRRARTACVPYRESKLTRLLGAGLSGARGEAVSMVVTLNPAAEYAHETRHVLQLAAVARDIQVNNTIAETILETTQDTTIHSSAEVMKLRSDNERLHFELLQAQARNKELLSVMEEKQQEAANTMRELVEEAKDMTRQYYEAQIQSLKSEMDEMSEEYEDRLSKVSCPHPAANTPSRVLQNKITQLMTDIAILEEKLTAESLARACAEEEVQHLRACIEERDEKAFEENSGQNKDVMMLTDSDHDSDVEDDLCNESLEPTFKKEDINRSLLQIQMDQNQKTSPNQSVGDSLSGTDVTIENENDDSVLNSNNTLKDDTEHETTKDTMYLTDDDSVNINKGNSIHIFTNDCIVTECSKDEEEKLNVTSEGCARIEDKITLVIEANWKNQSNPEKTISNVKICCKQNDNDIKSTAHTVKNESDSLKKNEKCYSFTRGTYFISDKNDNSVLQDCAMEDEVRDKVGDMPSKISETFVGKIINSIKSSHSNNSSLTQFEQLELAANNCDDTKTENKIEIGSFLKSQNIYFDDKAQEVTTGVEQLPSAKKKTYFDNISANIENTSNKILSDINKELDQTRSPSIVKDEMGEFKPSTMKILLGESFSRQQDVISSVHKNKILHKKQDSFDMFEGLDSPQLHAHTTKGHDVVEITRKSIENLVIEHKKSFKTDPTCVKQERKTINSPVNVEPVLNKSSSDCFHSTNEADSIKNISISKDSNENMKSGTMVKPNESQIGHNENNTIDEFENIFKDITTQSATEFDLLAQDSTSNSTINIENIVKEGDTFEETKYNLRHKSQIKKESVKFLEKIEKEEDQVIVEALAKCESKTKMTTKRSLRLRRRKNQNDSEDKSDQENDKLKDILNLQKEFSDVTLDKPAAVKEVKDIPSPEKRSEEENMPPILGIQSCPSKSVTRSRRKLFTPRAEPLEEGEAPGDSTERLYVPRPSYHRARARRKL